MLLHRLPYLSLLVCLPLVTGCNSTANTGISPTEALSLHSGSGPSSDGSLKLVKDLPAPAGTSDGAEQLLSPNDVLEINVYQVPSLNRTVQVDATGHISLPLIGVVSAKAKTQRQLEQELNRVYGATYLQSPNVSVFVKESAGQKVTIDGEVARSGLYPVTAGTTLLDAIALAGGFRDIADQSKVFIFRDVGSNKLVANYNVADIRSGRSSNPRVYGRDVIMVFTSQKRVALNNLKEALGVAASASRLAVIP